MKRQSKKQFLAALLAATLLLGQILPATVAAPSQNSLIRGDGYSFDPEGGWLIIFTSDGTKEWRNNTEIEKNDVVSVDLMSGVEVIGSHAFIGCTNLTTVVFAAASAPTLGKRAFADAASGNQSAAVPLIRPPPIGSGESFG